MPQYELKSKEIDHDMFKQQFKAFRDDTGFLGIFKKTLHEPKSPQGGEAISGEVILGVLQNGNGILVKIHRTKYHFRVEW